ncbi:MAG: hypothetical protein WDM77_17885 [Steroidobacteraceae bacterium]
MNRMSFTVLNHWVGEPADLSANIRDDVAALRSMPGVVDAEATMSYPLLGGGMGWGIRTKQDQRNGGAASTTIYFADSHGLDAMGLKLAGGRWFASSEIGEWLPNDVKGTPSAVLTAALAKKTVSHRQSGGPGYLSLQRCARAGDRDRTACADALAAQGFDSAFAEYSTFVPFQFVNNESPTSCARNPGNRRQ